MLTPPPPSALPPSSFPARLSLRTAETLAAARSGRNRRTAAAVPAGALPEGAQFELYTVLPAGTPGRTG